jgi:hypothetical protein
MFGVEQLFMEIVKGAEAVLVPCLPKVNVGEGAQLALLPVCPLFGQRIEVALPPPVATAITILRLAVAFCIGELESVTPTVKEEIPDADGVPLI